MIRLSKQNAALHTIAYKALNPKCGFDLHLIKLDPDSNTVQATNGQSLYFSKMPYPRNPVSENQTPVYLPGNILAQVAKSAKVKCPDINVTTNNTNSTDELKHTITLKAGQSQNTQVTIDNPDQSKFQGPVAWPDIDRITAMYSENPFPDPKTQPLPVTLSLAELDKVVTAYQQHHVKHVSVLVNDPQTPLLFKSEDNNDAGKTLTVYLMPCTEGPPTEEVTP